MDLEKLSKNELIDKCLELKITKCKSKTKKQLIDLINDNDSSVFKKCDIFTPDNIYELMASKLLDYGNLLDPSVGIGNLLKFIKQYDEIDVYDIKEEYLSQIPTSTSITISNINKFNLDFIKTPIDKKYTNIILNPPYIKIQDLPINYRNYITSNFQLIDGGSIDIYYAFIIKCLSLLKDDGIMVSITPNSYLYNKSSLKLRKYLFENKLIKEIIDFKEKKVFNDASVYCCITIFNKKAKDYLIYNQTTIQYSDIFKNYSLFNFNKNDEKTLKEICKITNGIATLRDKIYIHDTKLYDEPCWKLITSGSNNKYIIYPYENSKIIDEDVFKSNNPLTYNYLLSNKEELAKRDKGNKTYPAWYAYGRSQSIKISNKKCLYIPCFIDPSKIAENIYINQNVLHYSCLCIEPNDEKDIEMIKTTIIKNIDFIKDNSSKRSAGWISLSSTLLYDLPI